MKLSILTAIFFSVSLTLCAQIGSSNSISTQNTGACEQIQAVNAVFELDEICENLTWTVEFCGVDKGCYISGEFELVLEVDPFEFLSVFITIPHSFECKTMSGVTPIGYTSKVILAQILSTGSSDNIYTGPSASSTCDQ